MSPQTAVLAAWTQPDPAPIVRRSRLLSIPPLVIYDAIAVSNTAAAPVVVQPPPPPVSPLIAAQTVTIPSIGSVTDIANRIWSLLPHGWFANTLGTLAPIAPSNPSILAYAPAQGVLGSILQGAATALSWIYTLNQYVARQTRRVTTSDGFLDLGLFDFFAMRIRRKPSQSDASVRAMWEQEVLRRRNTRAYVQQAVEDLTGTEVTIFEPFNPMDTGGFGVAWALGEPAGGALGSRAYPYTMFITAVEPLGAGIPSLAGIGDAYGGLGAGAFALADDSLIQGAVTNQDIYDTINATRSAGVTCWVKIGPPPLPAARIGVSFVIGVTPLP
jgi:hypothetical protein